MDNVEREAFEREWAALSEEVLSGMANWRAQHRRATLSEESKPNSTPAWRGCGSVCWSGWPSRARPRRGGSRPVTRRTQRHAVRTVGRCWNHAGGTAAGCARAGARKWPSTESTASVRRCGQGLFPLDEELGLLPGVLTPRLQEQLAHLGAWMPFAPAARMLARFTGVPISAATARRLTEVVGRAVLAVEEAVVARLCDELPPVPAGPERAVLSVDGAMVPLVGGEWAEVKTLVVGEVATPGAPPASEASLAAAASPDVHLTAVSSCSRLADVEQFNAAVLGELHRRGVETAGQVAAVADGAE